MTWTPGPWTNPEPGVVESGGTWTFICPSVPDARLIAAAPEMAALLEELVTSDHRFKLDKGQRCPQCKASEDARELLTRIHGAEVTA